MLRHADANLAVRHADANLGGRWSGSRSLPVGSDWTRAVALLTYKEGLDAFRVMDRLSDSDRAALMGGTSTPVYDRSPAKV